jgi:hypothetical protein
MHQSPTPPKRVHTDNRPGTISGDSAGYLLRKQGEESGEGQHPDTSAAGEEL